MNAPVPRQLARFKLLRVLGRGAQATVWLAHDPRLDRLVAIKVMQAVRPGAGAAMEPWLREARHVARLSHPHIATLFEADVIDGQPSLVFELGFEGINRSPRHKSGIAVRFPRMLRIRFDKPIAEANTLQDLETLLKL